jgi:hypothetical protein
MLVITTVQVYPFINIKIHVGFTEKITPLCENYNSCILPAILDYLGTKQKVSLLQTLNRQVKKYRHSITLTARLLFCKNNGAVTRIQRQQTTRFTLFISVHMINVAKQSQLMHSIIVYLFNLSLAHLSDMFRQ